MIEAASEEVAPAHVVSAEPDPILYGAGNFEDPPADLDAPDEIFWRDDAGNWFGEEGDEWGLKEAANTEEEGARVALTPTVKENTCSEPSAQLEGEETERLTIGSEQRAALSTPTTSREATPAGQTLLHSMAPGHESPPASTPLQL
jgi:hypothetical protein